MRGLGIGQRLRRSAEPAETQSGVWDPLDRTLCEQAQQPGPVSEYFLSRLTDEDLSGMRAALTDWEREQLEGAPPHLRPQYEVSLAVTHVPGAAEHTGLSPADPPESVHAILRGSLYAPGALSYGDRIVEVVQAASADLAGARAVLDFGCSSGRLVRALAPMYPSPRWHGCDPIGPAIEWAARHFPDHEWLQSPLEPPLPYEDGQFDAVTALSIWSHFAERPARQWLDEMHRILAPGGILVLTTHGFQALRQLAESGNWGRPDIDRALQGLYRTGFYFHDVFGEGGDWGVPGGEDWGWAFISPEWVQTHLCPRWSVREFRPGYIDGFQDITVLERVSST
jgi:SAM-dependent methyltransferase